MHSPSTPATQPTTSPPPLDPILAADPQNDLEFTTPSSRANAPAHKKPKTPKKSGIGHKWKGKAKLDGDDELSKCYLLELPEDVIHALLVRVPPRDLLNLGATCKALQHELKGEAVWRQSYINRYLWDGASSNDAARNEVKVLVQGCDGSGGRGWKREALSREGMLERWTISRQSNIVYKPLVVQVHSLSLSYPPHLPNAKNTTLNVGKMSSPGGSGSASPMPGTPTPGGKLSHRQKYDAKLAVSTRPPPSVYCAGLEVAGLVKSDPLTGKVSKGFWGPSQDANFHLRPHWAPDDPVSAIFIPKRAQTHMLWGMVTGSTVHTTIQSRTHSTHGGRASSLNVTSKPNDMHEGPVSCLYQPESNGIDPMKWVTGGADGRVKYWQLNPGSTKSGKKTPEAAPASISCLFSSEPVEKPLENRSEEVKLRQLGSPDTIAHTAVDLTFDVVCGVTEDGDLRLWFDASTNSHEVRVDVGSALDLGGVRHLQLFCQRVTAGLVASVIVHHHKHPNFVRYDISLDSSGSQIVKPTFYGTRREGQLSKVLAFLTPAPAISQPPRAEPTMSARIVTPSSASGTTTPAVEPELETLPRRLAPVQEFGRFVVAGDEDGRAYIWEWDGQPEQEVVYPLRDWAAGQGGKITSIDASCGLVALGSFNGYVEVFDPLPTPPTRLRSFRPSGHLTPGDLIVAASDEAQARRFNVNQIILENDFIVAAIGRDVLAWRAGTAKGRQSGKDGKRGGGGGGKGEGRGHSRVLDLRDLERDTLDSHYEIQAENDFIREHTLEEAHIAAMEGLGLADGDAALEYALMLSQREADEPAPDADASFDEAGMSDDEAAAIRAVEAFERSQAAGEGQSQTRASAAAGGVPTPSNPAGGEDPEDLEEILEMIRLAEERERS